MTTATKYTWEFPKTLTQGRCVYKLVPQTRRDVLAVSREESNDFQDLVAAAFDGDCLLPVKSDAFDWFGWMLVGDRDGNTYAALVEYSDRDGTFAHQWCKVREAK